MSKVATTKPNGTRELALQRRKAMSSGGKSAVTAAGPNGASATSASSPAPAVNSASGNGASARSASLARRKQMSSKGKAAVHSKDRTRTETSRSESSRKEHGLNGGKRAIDSSSAIEPSSDLTSLSKSESSSGAAKYRARAAIRPQIASNPAKNAALARRKALSTLGKAGLNGGAMTEAQVARAGNPKLSSRELAKVLRDQRSKNGGSGHIKSAPCGRQRNASNGANGAKKNKVGAAQDAPWKVGASVTVSGQTVTGSMVGRHENMTGDEASTCRAITGTEYLGADIFNKFCQGDSRVNGAKTNGAGINGSRVNGTKPNSTRKVTVTSTSAGNPVSGNRMGRASNVTGNEPGACKRITGDEYISAEQVKEFCATTPSKPRLNGSMAQTMKGKSVSGNNVGRSENVTGNEYGMRQRLTGTQYTKPENIGSSPAKVGVSTTLRGSSVSGTMVGRGSRVTGDEPGSCRNVTGDDYIGQEQFGNFCKTLPSPTDHKVAESQTLAGLKVTGDLASRSSIVTGNESGTCKAVTGTPYTGGDQYQNFCNSSQAEAARARMQPAARTFARPLTGQQPGIGGLTGSAKGACEAISGTPYVGADQVAAVCPSVAAEPGSADYPQLLEAAQWGAFSVSTPNHASHRERPASAVTGSRYEGGHITGPFGMAAGKVTGTEQARFDAKVSSPMSLPQLPLADEMVHGRVKSRITGEGMESGLRITGDDWGRGERVTGTEGPSAVQRNLSLRGGPMSAMQLRVDMARPKDIPEPVSKVTGGSGNTEKGALITYSGGARG